MTGAGRGGGPRSMGASLLDGVLADTIDPAYAEAAAARAARTTAGAEVAAPRRWRARLLVGATTAAAGMLLAVTYAQAAATAQGREQIRARLAADIQQESAAGDELTRELEKLRLEVGRTRERLLQASAVGQRALDALARAEQGSAAVPVTGPGLLVTLANATPDADADPVGGTTQGDSRDRVQDGDLQVVVNALWAAGAEAISINGQRLGPSTAIRFAGEAVLVDFRPVANPYEVSAIGDPETLADEFLRSPEVEALAVISESFDLRFEFARESELRLPAANPPQLRFAGPADGGPDVPVPGRTTGG